MALLFILSYLGGALTILAPCILPIIPFVFARVDQPFVKNGLPLLAGLALTFAVVGTLGGVAGDWAVAANEYGRLAAFALLAVMGVTLIAPRWAERLTRPLVALGSHLNNLANITHITNASHTNTQQAKSPVVPSFFLGIATGLLWAPCAGPILGLILTGAALQGPGVQTTLLLLVYGAGAVSSLALVLLAGARVFAALKRCLGVGEWFRKGLGVTVLAGVAAVALGLDTGVLAQLPGGAGGSLEQRLFERFNKFEKFDRTVRPAPPIASRSPESAMQQRASSPFVKVQATTLPLLPPLPLLNLPVEGQFPPLSGAVEWLNSPPLTTEQLRGKVVLVDFWTFGCVNCRNALPYVREWHRKYKDQGLVVVGVHAPEFAFEKNIKHV